MKCMQLVTQPKQSTEYINFRQTKRITIFNAAWTTKLYLVLGQMGTFEVTRIQKPQKNTMQFKIIKSMSVSSSAANYCILSSGTVFYIWNHLQWDMCVCSIEWQNDYRILNQHNLPQCQILFRRLIQACMPYFARFWENT